MVTPVVVAESQVGRFALGPIRSALVALRGLFCVRQAARVNVGRQMAENGVKTPRRSWRSAAEMDQPESASARNVELPRRGFVGLPDAAFDS